MADYLLLIQTCQSSAHPGLTYTLRDFTTPPTAGLSSSTGLFACQALHSAVKNDSAPCPSRDVGGKPSTPGTVDWLRSPQITGQISQAAQKIRAAMLDGVAEAIYSSVGPDRSYYNLIESQREPYRRTAFLVAQDHLRRAHAKTPTTTQNISAILQNQRLDIPPSQTGRVSEAVQNFIQEQVANVPPYNIQNLALRILKPRLRMPAGFFFDVLGLSSTACATPYFELEGERCTQVIPALIGKNFLTIFDIAVGRDERIVRQVMQNTAPLVTLFERNTEAIRHFACRGNCTTGGYVIGEPGFAPGMWAGSYAYENALCRSSNRQAGALGREVR